jgi:hypothetical protein
VKLTEGIEVRCDCRFELIVAMKAVVMCMGFELGEIRRHGVPWF